MTLSVTELARCVIECPMPGKKKREAVEFAKAIGHPNPEYRKAIGRQIAQMKEYRPGPLMAVPKDYQLRLDVE